MTKGFDLKAEVYIDGKLVSSPHLSTAPNERAKISQKTAANPDTTIEVVASDYASAQADNAIKIQFTVTRFENGKRKVISRPQIVSLSGVPAELSLAETGKPEALKIKVIATRVQ